MSDELSALNASAALLEDVRSLLEHHPASKLDGPGRPASVPGTEPLLRACVALCYTSWEVYVEEALRETIEDLLSRNDAQALPTSLRDWVATSAKSDPWAFAGDGWRNVAMEQLVRRFDGKGGKSGFNTANPDGVIDLYNRVLGFEPLTRVSWQGYGNDKVMADIDSLVKIRGEIVHRGSTPGALNIGGVRIWVTFVERLCQRFDALLVEFRSGIALSRKK